MRTVIIRKRKTLREACDVNLLAPGASHFEAHDCATDEPQPNATGACLSRRHDVVRLAHSLHTLGPVLAATPEAPLWPDSGPSDEAPWPLDPRLLGLLCAARVQAELDVDSDGLCEVLWLMDRSGRATWAIALLPDSDYAAWDRLLAWLPQRSACRAPSAFDCGARADARAGPYWRAEALKFFLNPRGTRSLLGLEPTASLSATGSHHARAVARRFGWLPRIQRARPRERGALLIGA